MEQILPIIPISRLQREAGKALREVKDYAVVRNHSNDVAFILHPLLGKTLLQSGLLEELQRRMDAASLGNEEEIISKMGTFIGQVLRELGKK